MPSDGLRYIEWGFTDNSLRLFSTETGKVRSVGLNETVGCMSLTVFIALEYL